MPWFPADVGGLLVRGLVATLALWFGLSVYVIANRVGHDRRERRLSDPARLSRGRLYRMVADVTLPTPLAKSLAAHALERWGLPRLLSDAAAPGKRSRWRRVSALFALGYLRVEGLHALLRDALFGSDPEVASAAVVILGGLPDRGAAELLVAGLRANAYAPSRIATQLDQFSLPIDDLLVPLLADPLPHVRYWAVSLLARYSSAELADSVGRLADDPAPPVRKAVLGTLAAMRAPSVVQIARRHLSDPVGFVRSTAIRSVATVSRAAEPAVRREHAGIIVPLLGDSEWDVRLAAKESLVSFGSSIWREVATALDAPDRFARNGAAEVLQNLGLLDQLIDDLGRGAEPRPELVSVLERAFREGGTAMIDAAAARSDQALFPSVDNFLRQLSFAGVSISP